MADAQESPRRAERICSVIVNYRTPDLTLRCLEALAKERRILPNLSAIVVDGGSDDGSAERLEGHVKNCAYNSWAQLLALPINGGFGWANNQAILGLLQRTDPPDFILLLNPDAQIEPGAVVMLVDEMRSNARAGAVGSQLVDPDGSLAGSAFHFPTLRGELARGARTGLIDRFLRVPPVSLNPALVACDVDWVTGACVLLRAEALRQAGLFDDGFFLYHEETELMWRMRKRGWTVRHEPRSRVRHLRGAATGMNDRPTNSGFGARRPAYWYQSRRRLFARMRSRPVAAAAAMLWLAGHLFWRLRWLTGLSRNGRPVAYELRDHLNHAFAVTRDGVGSVPAWDSVIGRPPAWMANR